LIVLQGNLLTLASDGAIADGLLAAENGKIVYAGESAGFRIPEGARLLAAEGLTILPGMVDAHAHLTGSESVSRAGDEPYDLLLAAAHDLSELTDAGVTGVRDMSRFGPSLMRAVDRGTLRGPRIVPGGRVLSISSGHVDLEPWKEVGEYNRSSITGYLCDGEEGCLRAVRQMFREGARFIKICATGGVSSAVDAVDDIQFSDRELRVMVEEAGRHGTYVTAHCTGLAGAKQALKAGVKCIEHGVDLDEECVELMVKNDVTLVTTLTVALGLESMTSLPEHMKRKAHNIGEKVRKSFALARKAGVRVALGTDYSNSPNTPYAEIGEEYLSLTRVGYTNLEALRAGSVGGCHLMMRGGSAGTLEAGMDADVMAVSGDPLAEISLLANPENVRFVMAGDRVLKGGDLLL